MMRNLHIFFLLGNILFFLNVKVLGQNSFTDDLYINASYRPGLVLPEYSMFNYLAEDYVHSFELSISKQSTGENEWAQLFNYPEYGFAIQYSTLGNDQVFGREFSFYPFYNIHITDAGKFSFMNKAGLGLGVTNKKFDVNENPYNVAIGSALNLHFNFELNAQYRVRPKLLLYTGIAIDHFSNGNHSEPNLGINYITLNAGLRYMAGKMSEKTRYDLPKHIPTTRSALIFSIGSKHARALQDRSYFISSPSFELKRKLVRTFHLGIGADVFYDGASKVEVIAYGEQEYKSIDDFQTGIHFSQELVYNRFSVGLQEGFYVGLTEKAFDYTMYNRFIVRHGIGNRFFAHLAMKSHLFILDFIEFGVGYYIKP